MKSVSKVLTLNIIEKNQLKGSDGSDKITSKTVKHDWNLFPKPPTMPNG